MPPGITRRLISQKKLNDHEKKNLLLLEIIRRRGPIARSEVARLVDLNNVTVTSYVDQYIKKEIVQDAGIQISSGGRKPTLIDLNPDCAYAIGIGLDASSYVGTLINVKGHVLYKVIIERSRKENQKPLPAIVQVIEKILKESNVDKDKIHGIGVGVPGLVNQSSGTVRWPRGLLDDDLLINTSITNSLNEKFHYPILADNDANLAVFAEQWTMENGLSLDSVVYLYSGSGCGLFLNHEIYRGHNGCAGEFVFDLSNEDPIAWLKSAMESGSWSLDLGITSRARNELGKYPDSWMYQQFKDHPERITISSVAESASKGDDFAIQILKDSGKLLGRKTSYITNLLNPELIVVGGGLESAGVWFLDSVKKEMRIASAPEATEKIRIIPSQLGESAVSIGAAALVIQDFFVVS